MKAVSACWKKRKRGGYDEYDRKHKTEQYNTTQENKR